MSEGKVQLLLWQLLCWVTGLQLQQQDKFCLVSHFWWGSSIPDFAVLTPTVLSGAQHRRKALERHQEQIRCGFQGILWFLICWMIARVCLLFFKELLVVKGSSLLIPRDSVAYLKFAVSCTVLFRISWCFRGSSVAFFYLVMRELCIHDKLIQHWLILVNSMKSCVWLPRSSQW